mmetsp:Transcript_21153/g.49966  ORF Transcript_21153/g.49966 Transcript_21153/m.49966 type:complete len:347 (+) Transcript_21153:132-1172(+)
MLDRTSHLLTRLGIEAGQHRQAFAAHRATIALDLGTFSVAIRHQGLEFFVANLFWHRPHEIVVVQVQIFQFGQCCQFLGNRSGELVGVQIHDFEFLELGQLLGNGAGKKVTKQVQFLEVFHAHDFSVDRSKEPVHLQPQILPVLHPVQEPVGDDALQVVPVQVQVPEAPQQAQLSRNETLQLDVSQVQFDDRSEHVARDPVPRALVFGRHPIRVDVPLGALGRVIHHGQGVPLGVVVSFLAEHPAGGLVLRCVAGDFGLADHPEELLQVALVLLFDRRQTAAHVLVLFVRRFRFRFRFRLGLCFGLARPWPKRQRQDQPQTESSQERPCRDLFRIHRVRCIGAFGF